MCGKRHAIEAERQCRRADRVAARGEDRRVVPKLQYCACVLSVVEILIFQLQ